MAIPTDFVTYVPGIPCTAQLVPINVPNLHKADLLGIPFEVIFQKYKSLKVGEILLNIWLVTESAFDISKEGVYLTKKARYYVNNEDDKAMGLNNLLQSELETAITDIFKRDSFKHKGFGAKPSFLV